MADTKRETAVAEAAEEAKRRGRPPLPEDERARREREQRERYNQQRREARAKEITPPAPVAATEVSADDLAADLMGGEKPFPAVEHLEGEDFELPGDSPSIAPGTPGGESPPNSNGTDAAGEAFDPAKHRTGPDGQPMRNSDGRFAKKYTPRVRLDSRPDEFEMAAEIVVLNLYGITGMFLDGTESSPDLNTPEGAASHARLKAAYANYFRAKNLSLTSPGWMLVAANAAYIAGVAKQPKSKAKLLMWYEKIRDKIKKKKEEAIPV